MRTTVDIDEDVLEKLRRLSRAANQPMKEFLNETLRIGLLKREQQRTSTPFAIKPLNIKPHPGINFDSTSKLLEMLDEESGR